jgi:hypothetical protein
LVSALHAKIREEVRTAHSQAQSRIETLLQTNQKLQLNQRSTVAGFTSRIRALETQIQALRDEVSQGKQRENKLLYFLYVLRASEIPVARVFEREIRDLETKRFSADFSDDYALLLKRVQNERRFEAQLKRMGPIKQYDPWEIEKGALQLIDRVSWSDREYSKQNDAEDVAYWPICDQEPRAQTKPDSIPHLNLAQIKIAAVKQAQALDVCGSK